MNENQIENSPKGLLVKTNDCCKTPSHADLRIQ